MELRLLQKKVQCTVHFRC